MKMSSGGIKIAITNNLIINYMTNLVEVKYAQTDEMGRKTHAACHAWCGHPGADASRTVGARYIAPASKTGCRISGSVCGLQTASGEKYLYIM